MTDDDAVRAAGAVYEGNGRPLACDDDDGERGDQTKRERDASRH